MKIAIDLTSVSYHLSGIERYAIGVANGLLKNYHENEYILIFRNEVYDIFKKHINDDNIKIILLHGDNKLIFNQIILPYNLYKIKADVYLFFAFPSPLLFRNKNIYNTIHDMGAWDVGYTMKYFSKIYFKILYINASRISKKIFTVSMFSKGRINSILGFDKDRIVVTYSGILGDFSKYNNNFNEIKSKYNLPDKYVLFLSTLEPRKNLKLLLDAYDNIADKVDYNLVLVGREGWKIDSIILKYKNVNRITFTGFVDDEDLPLIYKNALCFVFPSIYEGFGLPPVEALSFGTPVIASNSSSIPEVLQENAQYFNNNNMMSLSEKLLNIYCFIKNIQSELNSFQKNNYDFNEIAKKIFSTINV